jgi:hypothetical protein
MTERGDDVALPRAWAWRDEPSGAEVFSGWGNPHPTLNSEPLYDQAAIDAAVAEATLALEKDALRYRWIRCAGAWESEIGLDFLSEDPTRFDAAVDGCMRHQKI